MAFIRTKLEEAVVISFEGFKLCSGQVHPKGDFQVGPVNGIRSAGKCRLATEHYFQWNGMLRIGGSFRDLSSKLKGDQSRISFG